jgi:hypothetical protein
MHAIETNMGLQYATGGTAALIDIVALSEEDVILFDDADTTYFIPTIQNAAAGQSPWLEIQIRSGTQKMQKLEGMTFHAMPTYNAGKIESWELGGHLAAQLGLRN